MSVIKSGDSTNELSIGDNNAAKTSIYDATSNTGLTIGSNNAARFTGYRSDGSLVPDYAVRHYYRASTAAVLVAPASTAPFFAIQGSATKTVRIVSIHVSGCTLTAAAYLNMICQRVSTATTGGTATALTMVPDDTNSAAGTLSLLNVYTAAPTAGTLVGTVGSIRFTAEDTSPVTEAQGLEEFLFYRYAEDGMVLRGVNQGLTLSFSAAPASEVTMAIEVVWTEE